MRLRPRQEGCCANRLYLKSNRRAVSQGNLLKESNARTTFGKAEVFQELQALRQSRKDRKLSAEGIFSEEQVEDGGVVSPAGLPVSVGHGDLVQIWKRIRIGNESPSPRDSRDPRNPRPRGNSLPVSRGWTTTLWSSAKEKPPSCLTGAMLSMSLIQKVRFLRPLDLNSSKLGQV